MSEATAPILSSGFSPEDLGWTPPPPKVAQTFIIPVGTASRHCSTCRATIYWIVTRAGRKMPVDPDGTSHFATCAQAAQHRRPR